MGKKIIALLGRTFKASKFKPPISLAISTISMLKNQCKARMSVAHSDVIELLKLGHHERALIFGPSTSDYIQQGTAVSTNTEVQTTAFEGEVVFDGSDNEDRTEKSASSTTRIHDLEYAMNHGLSTSRASSNNFKKCQIVNDGDTLNGSNSEHATVYKQYPLMSQPASESKPERGGANPKTTYAERSKAECYLQLNLENRPMSVMTR